MFIVKEETMTEKRENSFDGYIPAADGGRGLFVSEGPRRCDNCERWREKEGLGDFICRHMRGYKEAPANIRRCFGCNEWRKENNIEGNFWCKHNKYKKREWDQSQGW